MADQAQVCWLFGAGVATTAERLSGTCGRFPEFRHRQGPSASQRATEQRNPDEMLFCAARELFACKCARITTTGRAKGGNGASKEEEPGNFAQRASFGRAERKERPQGWVLQINFAFLAVTAVQTSVITQNPSKDCLVNNQTLCRAHSRSNTKCCCLLLLRSPSVARTSAHPTIPAAAAPHASGDCW